MTSKPQPSQPRGYSLAVIIAVWVSQWMLIGSAAMVLWLGSIHHPLAVDGGTTYATTHCSGGRCP